MAKSYWHKKKLREIAIKRSKDKTVIPEHLQMLEDLLGKKETPLEL